MPARGAALMWFRQDLRLTDNAALSAAVQAHDQVLAVYILDEAAAGQWAPGAAHRWWLHYSLESLATSLASRGAALILRRGNAPDVLYGLMAETGATTIHAAKGWEPWARRQEWRLAGLLGSQGLSLQLHPGVTLFDPGAVQTATGTPYSVYTAFARACRRRADLPPLLPAPRSISSFAQRPLSDSLADWNLLPRKPDWAGGLRKQWQPGEPGPGVPARSKDAFLRELLWREFSYHLLWHQPHLPERPLRPQFARMCWRDSKTDLHAWQRGQTGVPVVDAGMRQLWQTGWMHNRVRMITASFLVKHLLLPWQQGEAWFWDTLVDGDLANNSASWQWVAGSGVDAAPFFRIFNPVLQGRKFDPEGNYIRRYVPELARLGASDIHAPWEAEPAVLERAGIRLGETYPCPIVNLAEGRARALATFRAITASR